MKKKTKKLTREETLKKYGVKSGIEALVVQQLADAGHKDAYETLKIKYTIPASEHTYTPDFHIVIGGKSVIIETKGRLMLKDRQKHMYIKQQYPEADIRFLFEEGKSKQKADGMKKSKAQWCEINGFKWSEYPIPGEWLK